ncbi:UDP-N-acetylmuramoyl-tripeptide--D-alanyl-D-alanine ligase [Caviibacter abscessus]|uniref:UDP-N-acetylmuramoyl-tripeptide--D-alanyl-D- alanine ligase n=1 Tax=Caviibacter abscessus TaxID=1766719 RepID=UPI00083813FB|nr:UDP-N-acetylmuramoyl-tripeptide--D-alanyl-D-alanine ligase [Caviibacter abscessus]
MNKREVFRRILNENFDFSGQVCMDSKLAKKGDIFFAIRGGNKYIEEVIKKGAYPIYDCDKDFNIGKKVNDTVSFMQEFAKNYRMNLNAKVIAITGSNGKTTVKDILAILLENSYATYGNYNNHIGVPFTILSCPIDKDYLILEMGMSMTGEIKLLSSISLPDYSIITNIGDSHIEYLKTRENVFKAKTELIPYTKSKVIVNGKDEYLKTLEKALKVVLDNDVIIDDKGTSFLYNNNKYHTNLYGKHNAENISLCIAVLNEMGVSNFESKLDNIKLTSMRFELLNQGDNVIINDAYNAAPKSVESSLETLNQIFKDKYKVVILGDMLELGENEAKYHSNLKNVLKNIKYDKLYLYGKLMENLKIDGAIHTMDKNFIKTEIRNLKNAVIFLKGSRGMKLEEIVEGDR